MNRFILIALLAIAVIPLVAWGQEKPVAALGRVAVIGEISEGEKAIITNRLEKFLAARFQLVSEEEYLRAEDEAFLSLEEEECTEEACIRRIQEILQVDNLFILQIIREQSVTQLTLTLYRGDEKFVEEDICADCPIMELHAQIATLVALILGDEQQISAEPAAPAPLAEPEPELTDEKSSWTLWTGVALLAAAAFAQSSALTTNDDAEKKADDARAQDSAKLASDAKSLRSDAESQQTTAAILAAASAGFIVYYLFFADSGDDAAGDLTGYRSAPAHPFQIQFSGDRFAAVLTLRW